MKICNAAQILEISKSEASGSKLKIAIFDLDSTLYNVSGRQVQIFQEFASINEYQLKFPNETRLLQKIEAKNLAYYPVDCLRQLGLREIHPEFQKAYHEFWSPRFFSDNYLRYDKLEEGAAEFIFKMENAGFQIVFLTGRDIKRMGVGTERQLQSDGLLRKNRKLILKPDQAEEDHYFKLRIVQELKGKEAFVVFIDNEAKNLNYIYESDVAALCIFFDTVHSGKAEPHEDLLIMRSFV